MQTIIARSLKSLKKEKCIGQGVTEGGNHGKTFMPEYLAFWKENFKVEFNGNSGRL